MWFSRAIAGVVRHWIPEASDLSDSVPPDGLRVTAGAARSDFSRLPTKTQLRLSTHCRYPISLFVKLFSHPMHGRQLRWISTTRLIRNAAHGDGRNVTNHNSSRRASDFLWEAAEQEKREERQRMTNLSGGASSSNSRIANAAASAAQEHPNWTGDESIQDAVLRMLVDKYKPLRNESIRTAEEKIKKDLKPGAHFTTSSFSSESVPLSGSGTYADSLSQSSTSAETHKPWLTTFRPPSNVPSVKYMRLPPPLAAGTRTKDPSSINTDDTRSKMIERDRKKKTLLAGRLTNAKEGSLDYRIGKTSSAHANPVSLKGWSSLVEEKIEVC